MKNVLLFALCLLGISTTQAQFSRVSVHSGNVSTVATALPAGDNDFVLLMSGELYHLAGDTVSGFVYEEIENTLDKVSEHKMYDIDLDGDLDIVCWIHGKGSFAVYIKEDGRYYYDPEITLSLGPHHFHSQDFNEDGVEDVMINHNIYVTTGPNERERVLRYPLLNNVQYRFTHFFDYNDDGNQDILLHQVHWLRVLINNGTETTAQLLNLNETQNRVSWCRVINVDGEDRILYYDRSADMIREVHFAGGGYTIADVVPVNLNQNYSQAIVVDIDGDGNEEIITNSYNNREIVVISYNPDDNTGTATISPHGDNRFDAFGIMESVDGVLLLTGDPTSFRMYSFDETFRLKQEYKVNSALNINWLADFDGDGFVDVLGNRVLQRYLGEGVFGEVVDITYPSSNGQLVDYDEDGDLDYVKEFEWFENIGNLEFGPAQTIEPVDDPTPDPEIFFTVELLRSDIDLDGDIDILTYNSFGEPLELLENSNNVEFRDPVTLATSEHISGDAVMADVIDMNGDDLMDIVLVAHGGAVVLYGTGGLEFSEPQQIDVGDHIPLTAELEDINGDDFPDMVLGTRNIITGVALGDALFYEGSENLPEPIYLTQGDGYHRAAFANVNDTGWRDIVFISSEGLFWIDIESGVQSTTKIDGVPLQNAELVIRDLDSDGDDDIALFRDGQEKAFYYLNGETIDSGAKCPTSDLYLRSQAQIDQFTELYLACPDMAGDLFIGKSFPELSDINDLTPLKGIKRIEGNLTLWYNVLDNLSGLDSLESIAGNLTVDVHRSSDFSGIERLRSVGGDLHFNSVGTGLSIADLHEFTSLDSIGGGITVSNSRMSTIDPLIQPVLRGDLIVSNTPLTTTTTSVRIDSVYGKIELSDTELPSIAFLNGVRYAEAIRLSDNLFSDLTAFDSITHLVGDLYLAGNQQVQSFRGFESLQQINGDLYIKSYGISGMPDLAHVGGEVTVVSREIGTETFDDLVVIGNGLKILTYQGEDLTNFSNLRSLSGTLGIINNNISSLKGLEQIKDTLGSLSITSNENLLNLDHLNDSIIVTNEIYMWDNESLNYCSHPVLCTHLAAGRPLQLYGNGLACQRISDLRCNDNALSGITFYDGNRNGLIDFGESPMPNIELALWPSNDTILTTHDGFYITNAVSGDSLAVSATQLPDWEFTTSLPIVIDSFIPGKEENSQHNIGLAPLFSKRAYSIDYSAGIFLCDNPVELHIVITNDGTFAEPCRLEIIYPQHVTLADTFSGFTMHDLENRTVVIDIDTLYPLQTKQIILPLKAPGAEFLENDFTGAIAVLAKNGNNFELSAEAEYEFVLRCSYDPNDKLVKTTGRGNDIEFNSTDPITYTVRFQNSGNYYAANVTIIDTLSQMVDPTSIEFVASSHPVEIVRNENVLFFNFFDINLPWEDLDFVQSQGFVQFKATPVSTMTPGSRITNEANIYFDSNPPILTNEVESLVLESSSTNAQGDTPQMIVYPNPSKDILYIDGVNIKEGVRVEVLSSTGATMLSLQNIDITSSGLDISHLTPGAYIIRVFGLEMPIEVGRFVKVP